MPDSPPPTVPESKAASHPSARSNRWPMFVALMFLLPLLPFLFLGDRFETRQLEFLRGDLSRIELALAVAGLIVVDLCLPVPSTAVMTYAGAALGWQLALLASWGGLIVSCLIGFALGRWLGRPFAERFVDRRDLDALDHFAGSQGVPLLIVTRALPLFAEAAVLLLGASCLSWRRFLPAVAIANFFIAAVYTLLGEQFQNSPALPTVIVASALVPLAAGVYLRQRWAGRAESPK